MLTVRYLTKAYKKVIANNNVNFNVNSGETAILVGPNGAGKSTAIKSIAGLLRFKGEIFIDGFPNKSIEAKERFGYVPEIPAPFDMLTVYEHMEFIARAYKVDNWEEKTEDLLYRMELDDKKKKLGKELSKGMQQKLSICCALLPSPKVILLDEPFVGLDPHAIKELKEMLNNLKDNGCSILISTHMLDSVEELWDRCLIMVNGTIVEERTKKEIEESGEDLEQLFFTITESNKKRPPKYIKEENK